MGIVRDSHRRKICARTEAPLQHISRRTTENRALMPRWPARTELPGSLLPGRTSPAHGMRKRRRAANPRSAAPSSSARKRRLAVPKAFALHDGPVLQRAEAPPSHCPMQGRPAAFLLPRAVFLPQFGPRRRRPRSGGNPRLTRAWRIRIMSIAFRGCSAFARIPFAPVPQLDRGSAS